MSAAHGDGLDALPAFVALDARAVLDGARRGTSIQLDETYFHGQVAAIDSVATAPGLRRRREIVAQSLELYEQIYVDFDSLSAEALWTASKKFGRILRQLPEVQYLKHNFPGACFVLPEWLRSRGRVNYGARVYFFREESAPEPPDVLRRNVEAVVEETRRDYERHKGALHGYPECCFDFFSSYDRRADSAPELDAIEPIEPHVDDDVISADAIDADARDIEAGGAEAGGSGASGTRASSTGTTDTRARDDDRDGHAEIPSTSVSEIVDGVFETPDAYAFFAREFFPEPGCQQARQRGLAVYEALCERYPEELVRDHFRLNAGWSYVMARSYDAPSEERSRPAPGALGREHVLHYLPLSVLTSMSQSPLAEPSEETI